MKRIFHATALLITIAACNAMADDDADAAAESLEEGLLMNEYECTQAWATDSKKDEREAKRICASFTDDLRSGIESGWSEELLNQVMAAQWMFLNNDKNVSVSPEVDRIITAQLIKARKGAPDGPVLLQKAVAVDATADETAVATSKPQATPKKLNEMSFEEFAAAMQRGQAAIASTPEGKTYVEMREYSKQRQFEEQFKPLCKPGGVSSNCRQR